VGPPPSADLFPTTTNLSSEGDTSRLSIPSDKRARPIPKLLRRGCFQYLRSANAINFVQIENRDCGNYEITHYNGMLPVYPSDDVDETIWKPKSSVFRMLHGYLKDEVLIINQSLITDPKGVFSD
jgi:hypothetical protein